MPEKPDSETKKTAANRPVASITGTYTISCDLERKNAQDSDEKFTLRIAKDSKKPGMADVYRGLYDFGDAEGAMLLTSDGDRLIKRYTMLGWYARRGCDHHTYSEAWSEEQPEATSASKAAPELKFDIRFSHGAGGCGNFWGGLGEIQFTNDQYSTLTGWVDIPSVGRRVQIVGEKTETPGPDEDCVDIQEWVRRWRQFTDTWREIASRAQRG